MRGGAVNLHSSGARGVQVQWVVSQAPHDMFWIVCAVTTAVSQCHIQVPQAMGLCADRVDEQMFHSWLR